MTTRCVAEALSAIEDRLHDGNEASRWARAQLAVIRSLIDEVERRGPHAEQHVRRQIADELGRLVVRLDEARSLASQVMALQQVA
jgi:uncharacterized protein YicC (UPF0701 family)